MPNTRRGLVLLLVGFVLAGGAAWQTWQFEQQLQTHQQNLDRLTRQFSALELTVADLRTAQAGYVAAGQGEDFWMTRFDELSTQLEDQLAGRLRLAHPDAHPPLEAAVAQLDALRKSDQRARRYVANQQRLLASDVIYVESLDLLNRISTEIVTARETDWAVSGAAMLGVRRAEGAVAGGAVVLLLVLIGVAGRTAAAHGASAAVQPTSAPAPASVQAPAAPAVKTAVTPSTLHEAADVCVDLARLLDGRDLPALLSRAASAIEARGLVLWVVDEGRTTLRPTLAHGYSDRTLQKMGSLPVAADSITSVACRTLEPQTVPGALAVPLIGGHGCVGVLAAELSSPAATDRGTLAAARMMAAQLAGLITPLPVAQPSLDRPAASSN